MLLHPIARRFAGSLVALATATMASGCVVTVGSGEQPKVELTCAAHTVRIVLTNTSGTDHRYTATVDVGHDGMQEDFLLSSELVRAGAKAEVTEKVLTEDPITCKLKGVQTFGA
ncbi:MAG: hypothetical protein ACOH1Y_11220 [Propionicimonas sp.]